MKLTPEEQAWLEAYRQALAGGFPDLVERSLSSDQKPEERRQPIQTSIFWW